MSVASGYKNLSQSEEYRSFRNKVPLQKICVDNTDDKLWYVYDTGPKSVRSPLLCLAGASGTSDLFYLQLQSLSAVGIRVIAAGYPGYSTVLEWCQGFRMMLDTLDVDTPHILGVSLGGFLAQKFTEYTRQCPRVASLLLCHSYCDTADCCSAMPHSLNVVLPSASLRTTLAELDHHFCLDHSTVPCYNFAVEQLHKLSSAMLCSRIALSRDTSFVQPHNVKVPVTLLDAFNACDVRERAKSSLQKSYPSARLAYFKTKDTLPYLTQQLQFDVFVRVHLQEFTGTVHDPFGS
uniref:Maspardin n=1 Tax=Hirondellea gigas TaxID=1518452 RepID=A0A6A7FWH7_9CRUS